MIEFTICFIPKNVSLTYYFDGNKNFGDLKNYLEEKYEIQKGSYYLEMNDHVLDDNVTLKGKGVKNDTCIYVISNNCMKIKVKVKDWRSEVKTIQLGVLISDFKIIKADENKEIKV